MSDFNKNIESTEDYILSKNNKVLTKCNKRSFANFPNGIEHLLSGCAQSKDLISVLLPDTVKSIGAVAFANNEDLKTINLPKSLQYLSTNNPFGGCFNLENIACDSDSFIVEDGFLLNKEKTIIYSALKENFERKRIAIPSGVIELSGNLFWGFSNLEEIEFPDSIQIINDYCFCNCIKLRSVTLPPLLSNLPEGTFGFCRDLVQVRLGINTEYLGKECFRSCINLKSIENTEGVRSIGDYCFKRCKRIETLNLNSVVELGKNPFIDCVRLIHVNLDDRNFIHEDIDYLVKEYPDIILFDYTHLYKEQIKQNDLIYDDWQEFMKKCEDDDFESEDDWEWTDEDSWDAMTDGQYGDYPGSGWDSEYFGY